MSDDTDKTFAGSVSARELEILQHTTGRDKYGRTGPYGEYRNHFCAGDSDERHCRNLVARGLMRELRVASELSGGAPVFAVTDSGRRAISESSPQAPKLTRAQMDYRAFLASESDLPFIEFVRQRRAMQRAPIAAHKDGES